MSSATKKNKYYKYLNPKSKNQKTSRRILRFFLTILLIIVLVVLGYLGYVFIDYHRIEDNLDLVIKGDPEDLLVEAGKTHTTYKLTSWNIGFAAYTSDFSFFMDGGEYSRAFRASENTNDIVQALKSFGSDFYNIQEVDYDSVRSNYVDEVTAIKEAFPEHQSVFGINYDSPYLFYPVTCPIGSQHSGLLTLSNAEMISSIRRSLPIQTNYAKILDLDRCFTVSRIETTNGKELVLINFHLSAYTTDETIVTSQLKMLTGTIEEEYEKGNYVVCSGDFNMDLLGNSEEIFGVSGADYSWAQPFPKEFLNEGYTLIAPFDEENPVPTCRNANAPWDPETNFQVSLDGFIVSDNVQVISSEVTDTQFEYSDHNPVQLTFKLK